MRKYELSFFEKIKSMGFWFFSFVVAAIATITLIIILLIVSLGKTTSSLSPRQSFNANFFTGLSYVWAASSTMETATYHVNPDGSILDVDGDRRMSAPNSLATAMTSYQFGFEHDFDNNNTTTFNTSSATVLFSPYFIFPSQSIIKYRKPTQLTNTRHLFEFTFDYKDQAGLLSNAPIKALFDKFYNDISSGVGLSLPTQTGFDIKLDTMFFTLDFDFISVEEAQAVISTFIPVIYQNKANAAVKINPFNKRIVSKATFKRYLTTDIGLIIQKQKEKENIA